MQEQTQPGEHNPWHDAETRYQPGQEVRGTVTRITHFGVFVQVEPGLAGIIYTFELGSSSAAVSGFVPGQELHAYVRGIDAGRKRLELGLGRPSPTGMLEEHALPAELRHGKALDESPWPMPRPQAPSPLLEMPPERGGRVCPTCQHSTQLTWKYCVYCGGALRRHCPLCGSVQPDLPDARYCCECGKIIS